MMRIVPLALGLVLGPGPVGATRRVSRRHNGANPILQTVTSGRDSLHPLRQDDAPAKRCTVSPHRAAGVLTLSRPGRPFGGRGALACASTHWRSAPAGGWPFARCSIPLSTRAGKDLSDSGIARAAWVHRCAWSRWHAGAADAAAVPVAVLAAIGSPVAVPRPRSSPVKSDGAPTVPLRTEPEPACSRWA
jgi:hypothetical protein